MTENFSSPLHLAMSEDSSLPASELRRRYAAGGTLADSELSAAQLRARHGIASNKWERPAAQADYTVPAVVAVVILVLVVAYVLLAKGSSP